MARLYVTFLTLCEAEQIGHRPRKKDAWILYALFPGFKLNRAF